MACTESFEIDEINVGYVVRGNTNSGEKDRFVDLEASDLSDIDMKGECNICKKIESKFKLLLNDNEKTLMIQSNWRDLIDNFSVKFVPRLLSTPNKTGFDIENDNILKKLLRYNRLRIKNNFQIHSEFQYSNKKNESNIRNNSNDTPIIGLIHPKQYSTSIDHLSENNSENTGIFIIDELSQILHDKEIIMCQRYILFEDKYFQNIYEKEIKSLVWAVNGTIYHAGEEEYNIKDIKEVKSYFNISYSSPKLPLPLNNTPLIFINDLKGLKEIIGEILNSMEIHYRTSDDNSPFILSIDLEHHSTQTYRGFVSLIQMSTRDKDYIIDPFEIFHELVILNELTTNPRILKVFHGSDFDIFWLQRDFSVYVVNMFDTGKAAKVLNTPGGYSLKNLMDVYCNIDMDKTYQLSDWRERPLTDEKIKYARSDTHYLPYIYDILKNLLLLHSHIKPGFLLSTSDAMMKVENGKILVDKEDSSKFNINYKCTGSYMTFEMDTLDPSPLLTALHNSRLVSAKAYFIKPVDIWAKSHAIKSKFPRSCMNNQLERVLCLTIGHFLLVWREGLAKLLDLTPSYILKDGMIVKICSKQPSNETELFELFNPIPVNVKRHSEAILIIVNTVKNNIVSKNEENIFEFNSVISHIFSNISDGSIKCNEKEDLNAAFSSKKSLIKCKNMGDLKSKLCNKNISICDENELPSNSMLGDGTKKIKIKRSVGSSDNFANNLFGDHSNKTNAIAISDETLISMKIINEINNSLYRGTSSPIVYKSHEMNENFTSDDIMKKSYFPQNKVDGSNSIENMKKDTDDSINVVVENDQVRILRKSIKEEYDKDSDYIDERKKKKRYKKTDNEQDYNTYKDKEVVCDHNSNINVLEKQSISDINVKIKGLPASFACEKNIPDFIKNADSSSPVKTKKFSSLMRTKKWHKR
ncbi:RRPp PMC2 like exosome 3 exoribonuclease subunit with an RN domain and an HRDc domain [Cryptosporidium xiaoi]|uniref:RRPp PMC2 like exosome 3 exoribonuclease subunit with an RN domain and an HRDc domain n=1 Tax=Cryptosporidium xiaoi TaxID=659607 RepID=A0AAV9Y2U2_9CRYT